jgi:hypothetical protein
LFVAVKRTNGNRRGKSKQETWRNKYFSSPFSLYRCTYLKEQEKQLIFSLFFFTDENNACEGFEFRPEIFYTAGGEPPNTVEVLTKAADAQRATTRCVSISICYAMLCPCQTIFCPTIFFTTLYFVHTIFLPDFIMVVLYFERLYFGQLYFALYDLSGTRKDTLSLHSQYYKAELIRSQ